MRLRLFNKTAIMAVILLGSALPLSAAPSYDCDRQLTENEQLICERRGLANLDQEIADKFFELTAILNSGAAGVIRRDQREFLTRRQSCGYSVRCTRKVMMQRYHELDDMLQQQQAYRRGEGRDQEQYQEERDRTDDYREQPDRREDYSDNPDEQYQDQRGENEREEDYSDETNRDQDYQRQQNAQPEDEDICRPGFTNVNGECVHNSELEGRNERDNNQPGSTLALTPGEYGIYILANGADLRLDPNADQLLFTEQKTGNPNGKRLQSFIIAAHQGAFIIRDKQSGLMMHADDNGDGQVSTRYQPSDGYTKVLITNANEGCFYLQTVASGRYWTWEKNSQVIITRRKPTGEESMFCFKKQG